MIMKNLPDGWEWKQLKEIERKNAEPVERRRTHE